VSDLDEIQKLLLDRDTPLSPDLVPYLEETDVLGTVLKHPLVFQVPFHSAAFANKQLEWKRKALDEALAEDNWMTAVWIHERPYRILVLQDFAEFMDDKTYWDVVANIWTDSENLWQNEDEWRDLWQADREGRLEYAMDDDDKLVYSNLPETITVYRGCIQGENEDGMSWTTAFQVAEFFAKRFAEIREGDPIILCGEVSKEDVLAYSQGRNEFEVIVLPEKVRVSHLRAL